MDSAAEIIQTSIDSAVAAINAGKTTTSDPVVAEHIEVAVAFAEGPSGDPGYILSEIVSDPTLTPQQKDDAIATLWEMANGQTTPYGEVSESAQAELQQMFEQVGNAWTGEYTAEFRDVVTESIGRSVDSGRLSEDEVYDLVTADGTRPPTEGIRQLLTDATNAPLLSNLAGRFVDDARAAGYEFLEGGAEYLAAAADVANMAAERGFTAGATEVLDEIGRVQAQGLDGDRPIAQQIIESSELSATDWSQGLDERSGIAVLSGLLNSANTTTDARQRTADSLFATAVRSDDVGIAGSLDSHGDQSAALNELGQYFGDNVGRLAATDLAKLDTENSSSGNGFYANLTRDALLNIGLDPEFDGQDALGNAISNEIGSLLGTIEQYGADSAEGGTAFSTLAVLDGSLRYAAETHIKESGADSQQLRGLSDAITSRLISLGSSRAGPLSGPASSGANSVVDAIWDGIKSSAEARAGDEAEAAFGTLNTLLGNIREALGDHADLRVAGDYSTTLRLYSE